MSDALATSPLAHAIGIALVKFVWQGAAIGVMTALLLASLRRAAAQTRYIVACFGLAALLLVPLATVASDFREQSQTTIGDSARVNASVGAISMTLGTEVAATQLPEPGTIARIRAWIEPRLPFIVLIWSGGVLVLAMQLLRAWLRIGHMQRTGTVIPADEWPEAVRRIARRLGVTPRLRLINSALADVPAVIGFLRPAIVVPISALCGLAPADLEAILAHELAHVRRGDYLVNLIQCVVEVVLFYHPAVWWVSKQIRLEREHCCDDLAASLCADRVAYAKALASLEELRAAPSLAVAATGGDLLNRVRRLLEPEPLSGPTLSGRFAMTAVLTVLLAVSSHINGMPAQPAAGEPRQKPAQIVTVASEPSLRTSPNGQLTLGVAPAQPAARDVKAAVLPAPTPEPRPAANPVPNPALHPAPEPLTVEVAQAPASATGTITGVAVDPQGGVLPGATVTVTSTTSSTPLRTLVTNAMGRYESPVPSGAYYVTVSLPGFRTGRAQVQVEPNERVSITMRLQVGSVSESIIVRGGAGESRPVSATPVDPRTAVELFDAAKLYYQQGQLAEAELMTTRALAQLRAESPRTTVRDTPTSTTVTRSQISSADTQPASPRGPIRVGGDIVEPKKIKDVRPFYPPDALAAGVEGMVIIDAVIGKDGSVRDAQILRSVPMLNDAALDAVRQWAFTPTKLNGVPVEVVMTVTVTFVR